ncbi:MAG: hypothetical protein DAHOPDDO_01908 [Ignavibacteriaceae bacterium]|nr:hypothetical protein [Ignavibacteriaceae bacterium]
MKINFILVLAFISFIAYANIDYLHGIVGMTLRDGGIGCICHNIESNDSVFVWIEGPDSVKRNSTQQFKLFMSGGPAIAGGFNLASYFGELDSVDTLTHVMFGELTHTQPNPFINDTVSWNFLYTAPDSILTDTIYSVGNSVNWDSIPSNFDQWNFGQNFAVQVTDYPVNLSNENNSPKDFVLYQNYPNPFNPSTRISFQISDFRFVSLKVYDILGNEIAVLVNGNLAAGKYEVEFNINSVENRDLTSGIYFYQLTQEGPESNPTESDAGLEQGFAETKKMILLK